MAESKEHPKKPHEAQKKPAPEQAKPREAPSPPHKPETTKRPAAKKAPSAASKAAPTEAPAHKASPEPKRKAHPKAVAHGGVNVYGLDGSVVRTVELPNVFHVPLRPDLVRRAVVAAQANRRQPYGAMFNAGRRHSVRWPGKGRGAARTPRIRGTMIGAQSPNTVGGARAHPPRPEKVWAKKVNQKELRMARAAALAALKEAEVVRARGHRFDDKLTLPVILDDAIEARLPKVKGFRDREPVHAPVRSAIKVLEALGIIADVQRAKDGIHVRAGRGKMRGRRWREPRGPLLIVTKPDEVRRSFGNMAGVEIRHVSQIDTEVLAPGGMTGRLTIFSESALEALRGW